MGHLSPNDASEYSFVYARVRRLLQLPGVDPLTAAPQSETNLAMIKEKAVTLPFFTIGHSTRSLAELCELLKSAEVGALADIRTVPRSRTNPQFNRETLPDALQSAGISYEHMASLGGLRPKSRSVPADVNAFWTNDSFHNFADYALSADFRSGLSRLLEQGSERRCAIMCAESVWWRCHRRIVSDYLIAREREVFHIMGQGRLEAARLTAGAVIRDDATVVYPAASG